MSTLSTTDFDTFDTLSCGGSRPVVIVPPCRAPILIQNDSKSFLFVNGQLRWNSLPVPLSGRTIATTPILVTAINRLDDNGTHTDGGARPSPGLLTEKRTQRRRLEHLSPISSTYK